MAGSVNKVLLIGRVGKDPEIRTTQSGAKIANLSIATSDTWRDKASGERKEKTEWHRVVCFNDHITKVIEQYVKKGALLWVEGSLQTRKWTDQSGAEKYSTEVVIQAFNGSLTLLDSGGSRTNSETNTDYGFGAGEPQKSVEKTGSMKERGFVEDEIPF